METTSNDELGFDSTLSPEVIELLMAANVTSDVETVMKQQTFELDEHEQALVC